MQNPDSLILFKQKLGLPSEKPLMFYAKRAEGIYIYDINNKPFIDLVSGVSVSNLGHSDPEIADAVKKQVDKHMHLMVYGEFVQNIQIKLAELLTSQLHHSLNSVYYVNSGSEAIEGAMKLSKRYTGRSKIIAFKNAYHGSTHGALSILGSENFKTNYRPLLPDIHFLDFNDFEQIQQIDNKTAAVIVEPIQAEAGIVIPKTDYLKRLREKCNSTGTLLVFDEIQTGFGRTGKLFAHQHYNVIPDIMCVAKAFGGGMPLGAFISDKKIMDSFKINPALGHITTFGGHPVSCAAAYASLNKLLREKITEQVEEKADLFFKLLKHKKIKNVWGKGLFIGIELENAEEAQKVMEYGAKSGFITDLFLFKDNAFRIGAPLIISKKQIKKAVNLILNALDNI